MDDVKLVFPETATKSVPHRRPPSYPNVGPRHSSPPVGAGDHVAVQQGRLLRPDPVPRVDWAALVLVPMSFGALGSATTFTLLALNGWLAPQ